MAGLVDRKVDKVFFRACPGKTRKGGSGKGEKVYREAQAVPDGRGNPLAVRAHRGRGDTDGRLNPIRSKTK